MPDFLRAALRYADRGLATFPCEERGKRPLTRQGYHDASRDEGTLHEWWAQWPGANVGLPCEPNGIIALDVDPRAGGDTALAALLETHALPVTVEAVTGGGGRHLLFTAPRGWRPRGAVAAGLDVKFAGYLVVAPSVHPSGGVYRWCDRRWPGAAPFADLPPWLAALMKPEERQPLAPAAVKDQREAWDRAVAYLRQVPGATEGGGEHGGRDRGTYGLACRLLERFPQLGPETVEDLLVTWDAQRNLPPLGSRVVRQKVASAMRGVTV